MTEVTTISYTLPVDYVLTAEEQKAEKIPKQRLEDPEAWVKKCEEKKREEERLAEIEKRHKERIEESERRQKEREKEEREDFVRRFKDRYGEDYEVGTEEEEHRKMDERIKKAREDMKVAFDEEERQLKEWGQLLDNIEATMNIAIEKLYGLVSYEDFMYLIRAWGNLNSKRDYFPEDGKELVTTFYEEISKHKDLLEGV